MQSKIKLVKIFISMLCLAMLFLVSFGVQNNIVYADDSVYVNLSYVESDTTYTIYATSTETISYPYEIIFSVNDLNIIENEQLSIKKDDSTTFVVSCILRDMSENPTHADVKSQTLTLAPQTMEEESSIITPAMEVVFKALLPVILVAVCVILIVISVKKRKSTPFGHLVKKLKSIQKLDKETVALLKDEKAKPRTKSKKFLKFLKKADNISYNCISKIIPINIESMGQYNSLLSNLYNLNNIISAGIKTYSKTNMQQKERLISELHRNLLPNAVINAEETNSAWEKQMLNSEKQFMQQSLYKKSLVTDKDYQQLLKRTVFYKNDQREEGADKDDDD